MAKRLNGMTNINNINSELMIQNCPSFAQHYDGIDKLTNCF